MSGNIRRRVAPQQPDRLAHQRHNPNNAMRPYGETVHEAFNSILSLIEDGIPVHAACARAGFSRLTMWNYVNTAGNEDAAAALTLAKDRAEARMAKVVADHALGLSTEGDPMIALRWLGLRTRGWREKGKIDE